MVLIDANSALELAELVSPIQWALDRADKEGLPWVVTVQADRIRLYPRALDVGVGRRGRRAGRAGRVRVPARRPRRRAERRRIERNRVVVENRQPSRSGMRPPSLGTSVRPPAAASPPRVFVPLPPIERLL